MTGVLVALGAGLGAAARYLAGLRWDRGWPAGTFTVNVLGSFLLGVLLGRGATAGALALLGVGFCGALTTYSALALQTHGLATDRGWPAALGYSLGTIGVALAGCVAGYALGS